jgi:hypothetical protein
MAGYVFIPQVLQGIVFLDKGLQIANEVILMGLIK